MTITNFNRPALALPTFLDEFFKENSKEREQNYRPAVNIFENGESFFIEVIAPGRKKEDFKIQVEKDLLSVSTEGTTASPEGRKYSHREFNLRKLSRSFKLPEDVDQAKIKGSYEGGILTLELPKKEEKKDKGPIEISIA